MRLLLIIPGLVALGWGAGLLILSLGRAGSLYWAHLDTPHEIACFTKQFGWALLGFCVALTALNSLAS